MGKGREAELAMVQTAQRYADSLTRYASRICGDAELARDVVQETLISLWKAPRDEVEGHLVEWLYTVCRRKALDVRRKQGRSVRLADEQEMTIESQSCDPREMAESRDLVSRAAYFIAQLSENQQEVVRLKFQHGLSYKQIAAVMGISETNVGFILHVAIKTVREKLQVKEAGNATANR